MSHPSERDADASPKERAGDGRDGKGRFLVGNQAAAGVGGAAKHQSKWRALAFDATSDEDMLAVWAELIRSAKAGEPWAVHEFLDRMMGKAQPAPPDAQQDVSAVMARLWREWASPRPESGPVEDAQFVEKPDEGGQLEGSP